MLHLDCLRWHLFFERSYGILLHGMLLVVHGGIWWSHRPSVLRCEVPASSSAEKIWAMNRTFPKFSKWGWCGLISLQLVENVKDSEKQRLWWYWMGYSPTCNSLTWPSFLLLGHGKNFFPCHLSNWCHPLWPPKLPKNNLFFGGPQMFCISMHIYPYFRTMDYVILHSTEI